MSSYNNRLNRKPKGKRYIKIDPETIWDCREAGDLPLFEQPQYMEAPPEVIALDGGPKKRRIVRQFVAPCPLTGNLVPCRELAPGPLFCWESPSKGFLFGFREDLANPQVIDIDCDE